MMVVITLQYRNVSNQHLHALSLDSVIDLLWLSKAGKIESSSQVQCKRSNVGRAVGSQGDSAICVTSWELLGCHAGGEPGQCAAGGGAGLGGSRGLSGLPSVCTNFPHNRINDHQPTGCPTPRPSPRGSLLGSHSQGPGGRAVHEESKLFKGRMRVYSPFTTLGLGCFHLVSPQ